MNVRVIDTGQASAATNMEIDQKLLEESLFSPELLWHFYDWETASATYGYFIDPFAFLNASAVNRYRLDLARRPTGGGIVFHVSDFAFSLLVPAIHPAFSVNTLDNYAFVNHLVALALQQFLGTPQSAQLLPIECEPLDPSSRHFCMAKPTKYDVMLEGRKVGGGAQRRTKQGFLHQGTISLAMPSEDFLNEVLLPDSCVLQSMRKNTFALLGNAPTQTQMREAKKQLRDLLVHHSNLQR